LFANGLIRPLVFFGIASSTLFKNMRKKDKKLFSKRADELMAKRCADDIFSCIDDDVPEEKHCHIPVCAKKMPPTHPKLERSDAFVKEMKGMALSRKAELRNKYPVKKTVLFNNETKQLVTKMAPEITRKGNLLSDAEIFGIQKSRIAKRQELKVSNQRSYNASEMKIKAERTRQRDLNRQEFETRETVPVEFKESCVEVKAQHSPKPAVAHPRHRVDELRVQRNLNKQTANALRVFNNKKKQSKLEKKFDKKIERKWVAKVTPVEEIKEAEPLNPLPSVKRVRDRVRQRANKKIGFSAQSREETVRKGEIYAAQLLKKYRESEINSRLNGGINFFDLDITNTFDKGVKYLRSIYTQIKLKIGDRFCHAFEEWAETIYAIFNLCYSSIYADTVSFTALVHYMIQSLSNESTFIDRLTLSLCATLVKSVASYVLSIFTSSNDVSEFKAQSGMDDIKDDAKRETSFLSFEDFFHIIMNLRDHAIIKSIGKIFTILVGGKYVPKAVQDIVNNFKMVTTDVIEVITHVYQIIGTIASNIYLYVSGNKTIYEIVTSLRPEATLISKMRELIALHDQNMIVPDDENRNFHIQSKEWISRAKAVLTASSVALKHMSQTKSEYVVLNDCSRILQKNYEAYYVKMMSMFRPVPLAFVIGEDPGVGKSSMLQEVSMAYCKVINKEYSANITYSRVASSAYWEGYDPLVHDIVHYSECGSQAHGIAASQPDEVLKELTSVIDSAPFALDMASVDLKGKYYFLSNLVLLDTNNMGLHLDAQYCNAAAYRRRFIYIKMAVKQEFADYGSLCKKKVAAATDEQKATGYWHISVYVEIPRDKRSSVRRMICKTDDLREFRLKLQVLMKVRLDENRDYISYLNDKIDSYKTLDNGQIADDGSYIPPKRLVNYSELSEQYAEMYDYSSSDSIIEDLVDLDVGEEKNFEAQASCLELKNPYDDNPELDECVQRIMTRKSVEDKQWSSEALSFCNGFSHDMSEFVNSAGVYAYCTYLENCTSPTKRLEIRLPNFFYVYYVVMLFAMLLDLQVIVGVFSLIILFMIDQKFDTRLYAVCFVASLWWPLELVFFIAIAFIVLDTNLREVATRALINEKKYQALQRMKVVTHFAKPIYGNAHVASQFAIVAVGVIGFSAVLKLCSSFFFSDRKKKFNAEFKVDSVFNEPLDLLQKSHGAGYTRKRIQSKLNSLPECWSVKEGPIIMNPHTVENFQALLDHNVRHISVSGDQLTWANSHLLFLQSNVALVNTHILKRNFPMSARVFKKESTVEFEFQICEQHVKHLGNDLSLIYVVGRQAKSLLDYIVDEPSRLGQGYLMLSAVNYCFKSTPTQVDCKGDKYHIANTYQYELASKEGDCGLPLIAMYHKTPMIIGFHAAGGGSKGLACALQKQFLLTNIAEFVAHINASGLRVFNAHGVVTRDLYDPIEKSYVRYENFQGGYYLGKLPGVVNAKGKSKLIYSKLVEDLPMVFQENFNFVPGVKYVKPHMQSCIIDGSWSSPHNQFLRKLPVKRSLDQQLLAQVVNELCEHLFRKFDEAKVDLTPYTVEMAINGNIEDDFFRRMSAKTSAGFGFKGKKGDYFPLVEDDYREFTSVMKGEVFELICAYERGNFEAGILKTALKDEPRPVHKSHTPRVFTVSDVIRTCAQRMYLGPFYTMMLEFSDLFCAGLGTDMHRQAHTLFNKLTMFSDKFIEGDYGGFDTSMPVEVGVAASTVVYRVLAKYGYNDRALKVVDSLLTENMNPVIEVLTDLYHVPGYQPSGKYATAEDNSLRGLILLMYAWKVVNKNENFFDKNLPLIYGDDVIVAVKEDSIDIFNNHTYSDIVSLIFGMKFTNAQKTETMKKFLLAGELSFLKRTFRHHNALGRVVGVLELDSIYKMLEFVLPSRQVTVAEQVLQTIDAALREIFLHCGDSDVVFNNVRSQLIISFKTGYSLDITPKSYDEYLLDLTL